MLKRPQAGDTEEDLLEFQRQFLEEKTKPSASVLSKVGDKRKTDTLEGAYSDGAGKRDVVQLEGLPQQPPAENVPPIKKSRFKLSQERATAKKKSMDTTDDPEEMIDKQDTHMAAVLTKIIERDTRNMAVQMPHGVGLGFPAVQHVDPNKKVDKELKKKSLFAQQFAEAHEKFGKAAGETDTMEGIKSEPVTEFGSVLEGTGLSATFGTDEVRKIHEENVDKLAGMSQEEIMAEQNKLLQMLDPKLVDFLKTKKSHMVKVNEADIEMQQGPSVAPIKLERKEDKGLSELAVKVQKDWVHMDKVEYEKLEWMKDLPKPQAGDTQTGQQARFDFQGNLLSPDVEVPVNVGLHHHGDEPERAGYTLEELFQLCRSSNNQQRTLALQTLGKVIQQAKEGKLSQLILTPILPSILDAGVIFLLRWSLDDSVDAVVVAAVAALNALLVNQADELCLDRVFHWNQGHRVPSQAPVPPASPGIKLPDVIDEKGEETDADIAKKDLILALVSRMSLLPRLKYILEVVKPQAPTVIHILQILVRVARHSVKLAYQIVNFKELMSLVVEKFLPLSWLVQDVDQPLSCVYGVPVAAAMRLIKTLAQAGRNMAAILLSEYKITDRLLRYLAVNPRNLQLPELEAYRLHIESLNMWTVCLSYGLADAVYLDLFPSLVEQLKTCQGILEQTEQDQNRLTALIAALQAVVCVAGITTQHKGFSQERSNGSGDMEMSEEISSPLVNWSHVTDLIHPIKLLLRDTLQEIATNYQIKRHHLQVPSVCLDFVTTFYGKFHSKVTDKELVSCLEEMEELYRMCMGHCRSFGFQTIISELSKYSNLLQPEESLNREVSSCLPELGNSSLSEDNFLPVVCRKSTYNFLLSLLRMMTTFTKLHKGLVTQELADPFWTYLKKIALGRPSHMSTNYFTKFENMLQYYIIKLLTVPSYEKEISSEHRNILHCVTLTLLTCLHHGDEHLAHDLLSTVVFSLALWSDSDTESTSARLEDLNILDTTPTHLHSATQEEITFNRDLLCKDAIAKLVSIRATYLSSMSGSEKQVIASSNHYHQNPQLTRTCFTSHIGECMLPRDWMFLPLIELYNTFSLVGSDVQNVLQTSQVGTVCNVLRWIYLLETHRPEQLLNVSVTLKLSRIMCVYLTGNDLFLDQSVHCYLAGLLRHYTRPNLLVKIDFTENIPGLASFYDLHIALLQQYEAVSFGDSLFGSYILIALQQCHDIQYRKAIWTENAGILRTLSLPLQELLFPIDGFLQPEESNVEMLRLCYQSLFGESLRHTWSPVLYLIAVHHVNRFMYTQDGKHTKIKRTMLTQILRAKNQELRHHLMYYKQADVGSKLGMELYTDLPPIRQKFIDSLNST